MERWKLYIYAKGITRAMLMGKDKQQVAQCAMIAHLGASIMFGDTIIWDAQLWTWNSDQE